MSSIKKSVWWLIPLIPAFYIVYLSLRPWTFTDVAIMSFFLSAFLVGIWVPIGIGFARFRKDSLWLPVRPALCSLVLIASVALTQWPFRAAFAVSKPALERAFEESQVDGNRYPGWAGLFYLERVEDESGYDGAETGTIRLWTDYDLRGRTGFINAPNSEGFLTWSESKLSKRWMLITED